MTRLTYKIVDEKNITLMSGILTLAEATDAARRYGAKGSKRSVTRPSAASQRPE